MNMRITNARWARISALVCATLLCILGVISSGQTAFNPGSNRTANSTAPAKAIAGSQKHYSLDIGQQPMSSAVSQLELLYGFRIGFEDIDYKPEDIITLGDVAAQLRSKAATRPLFPIEKSRLELASDRLARGDDPHSTFDIAFFRLEGNFNGATPGELLDKLTANGPFQWSEKNGAYLIKPAHGSVLAYPVILDMQDRDMQAVCSAIIAQQPKAQGKGEIEGLITPPHTGFSKMINYQDIGVKSLVLNGIPADEALCRACEAAAPHVSWALAGLHGRRDLALYEDQATAK